MMIRFAARALFGSLTALAILAVNPQPVDAQERVYVQAVDERTGRVVTNLRREQVLVRESGVLRDVLAVRPANLPIKLTVLVDNGAEVATAFNRVQDGLRVFFDRLPPNQEMSLVTLAPEPRWVVTETLDRDEIQDGIDLIEDVESPVRFLDGIIEASARIDADQEPHRPVIVLVAADGPDASSDLLNRWQPLLDQVYRNGVTVHTLLMSTPRDFGRRRSLQEAAGLDFERWTGGYYKSVYVGSSLNEPLTEVANEIRARSRELASQHMVLYDRPGEGVPQDARVTLTRMGVRVISVTMDGKLR